ncbi:MAG: hypothetical protein AAF513_04085 [Pseudomonadota bacterium]
MWRTVQQLFVLMVCMGVPMLGNTINAGSNWATFTDGDLLAAIKMTQEGIATCEQRLGVMNQAIDALDPEKMGQVNYNARSKRYRANREDYRSCLNNLNDILDALIAERTKRVGGTVGQPEPGRSDARQTASADLLRGLKGLIDDIPPLGAVSIDGRRVN